MRTQPAEAIFFCFTDPLSAEKILRFKTKLTDLGKKDWHYYSEIKRQWLKNAGTSLAFTRGREILLSGVQENIHDMLAEKLAVQLQNNHFQTIPPQSHIPVTKGLIGLFVEYKNQVLQLEATQPPAP